MRKVLPVAFLLGLFFSCGEGDGRREGIGGEKSGTGRGEVMGEPLSGGEKSDAKDGGSSVAEERVAEKFEMEKSPMEKSKMERGTGEMVGGERLVEGDRDEGAVDVADGGMGEPAVESGPDRGMAGGEGRADRGGRVFDDQKILNQLMNEIKNYQTWDKFPGLNTDQNGYAKGGRPHGKFIRVFVNKKNALTADGSIIVKEAYQTKGTLHRLAIMKKIKGYDPNGGDWFWLYIQVAGGRSIITSGKASLCSNCHSAAKGGDFIFLND